MVARALEMEEAGPRSAISAGRLGTLLAIVVRVTLGASQADIMDNAKEVVGETLDEAGVGVNSTLDTLISFLFDKDFSGRFAHLPTAR